MVDYTVALYRGVRIHVPVHKVVCVSSSSYNYICTYNIHTQYHSLPFFIHTHTHMVEKIKKTVTDLSFLQFFQQYGEVIDSVVLLDRRTKRSRGFGFVTFADPVRTYINDLVDL